MHRTADPTRHRKGNRLVQEEEVREIKTFRSEPFSPPLFDRISLLYAAPRTFVHAETRRSINDWQALKNSGLDSWQVKQKLATVSPDNLKSATEKNVNDHR